MNDILIGTSGYSYEDWREVLYPPDLPKEEFLRYYSLFFPFTELNFSYYAMPSSRGLLGMVKRTPASFKFSIKAHKSLTHEVDAGWRDNARQFTAAVSTLAGENRLEAVLIQLPFSFHHTPDNRSYLSELLAAMKHLPLVVEFRNDEWYTDRVYDELDKRGVGCAMVDRPDLPGLPPMSERVTGGRGYIRFHGRNETNWWSGDNVSRYDYLYSDEELMASVPKLRRMAKAGTLMVAFNNHAKGKAVSNAKSLKGMLFPE